MTVHREHIRRLTVTALMTAMILVTTAYVLHIPVGTGGGYIHLGDTLVYLAAAMLPCPYAAVAAALGGALADVLTGAAIWALPTAVIKALMVLPFTAKDKHLLCRRNRLAPVLSGLIGMGGYALAGAVLYGSVAGAVAELLPNGMQAVACGALFAVAAAALDRVPGGRFWQ